MAYENLLEEVTIGEAISPEAYEAISSEGSGFKYIKVNIPSTRANYENGNGEGCWALITEKDVEKYEDDNCTDAFKAVLANYSVYYDIPAGTVLPCHFNKEHRPLVSYDYLEANYSVNAEENRLNIVKRIIEDGRYNLVQENK